MKDRLGLIVAGAAASCAAWAFWHFLGQDALSLFPALALVLVTADNVRLRRKLRAASMRE